VALVATGTSAPDQSAAFVLRLSKAAAGGWRSAQPPAPARSALSGASCPSAGGCTVVGTSFALGEPVIDSWDGQGWGAQRPPARPRPASSSAPFALVGVSCWSATGCMAVGLAGGRAMAAERRGRSWAASLIGRSASPSTLDSVSCVGSSFCVAVGESLSFLTCPAGSPKGVPCVEYRGVLVEQWDGERWRPEPAPSPSPDAALLGVSCVSAADCVAVGKYAAVGRPGGPSGLVAERWDGRRWRLQAAPTWPGAALVGVSCASADYCEAVGEGPGGALAEGWDGTAWRAQPIAGARGGGAPGSGGFLEGVSCASRDFCEAVGRQQSANAAKAMVVLWDGSAWAVQPAPGPKGSDLEAVSCAARDDCVAVGFVDLATAKPLVEHDGPSAS
jgi:hypothetical protein